MSLCKVITFLLAFFFFAPAMAQQQQPTPSAASSQRSSQTARSATPSSSSSASANRSPHFSGVSTWDIEFSYVSWKELLTLTNGPVIDHGYSDYIGNAVVLEYEHYAVPHWGFIGELGVMSGKADIGGSQTQLVYQQANVGWTGEEASIRAAYRFSATVIASLGPMAIARQITLPVDPDGSQVESGSSVNYGMVADVRLKLDRRWEVRETLGTLLQHATTLWSFGLGCTF